MSPVSTGVSCYQDPAHPPSWELSQVACDHLDPHPPSGKGPGEGQHVTMCPPSHCDHEHGARRTLRAGIGTAPPTSGPWPGPAFLKVSQQGPRSTRPGALHWDAASPTSICMRSTWSPAEPGWACECACGCVSVCRRGGTQPAVRLSPSLSLCPCLCPYRGVCLSVPISVPASVSLPLM